MAASASSEENDGFGCGFFHAAKGINLAQWQVFCLRSLQYVRALLRDTSMDQALHNRELLESRWKTLFSSDSAAPAFYVKRNVPVEFERTVL